MRVLFLTPRPLHAPDTGGLQVSSERVRQLAAVADVTVAHLEEDLAAAAASSEIARRPGVESVAAGRLRRRTALGLARSYLRGLPLSVWRNSDPDFIRQVEALRERPWDLLYVDHWLVWEAARHFQSVRRILHLHNAEHELFRLAATRMRFARRAVALLETRRAARFLRTLMPHVDELHLLSDADRVTLASAGVHHPNTRVFLPAVEAVPPTVPGFDARDPAALFVGSLGWPPNDEGLRWFVANAWRLTKAVSRLDVVGGGASTALRALAQGVPRVRLHGFVEDLEPLYARARCLVAPLLSGSGIKIKIVNSLARGLPVATTSRGCEGMPDRGGRGLLVADTPAELAALIDRIVVDREMWSAASAAARTYALQHFSGFEFARWCRELTQGDRVTGERWRARR